MIHMICVFSNLSSVDCWLREFGLCRSFNSSYALQLTQNCIIKCQSFVFAIISKGANNHGTRLQFFSRLQIWKETTSPNIFFVSNPFLLIFIKHAGYCGAHDSFTPLSPTSSFAILILFKNFSRSLKHGDFLCTAFRVNPQVFSRSEIWTWTFPKYESFVLLLTWFCACVPHVRDLPDILAAPKMCPYFLDLPNITVPFAPHDGILKYAMKFLSIFFYPSPWSMPLEICTCFVMKNIKVIILWVNQSHLTDDCCSKNSTMPHFQTVCTFLPPVFTFFLLK